MVLGSPAGYDAGLLGNLSFSYAIDSKNTFSPQLLGKKSLVLLSSSSGVPG